jgi:hypothetical protein
MVEAMVEARNDIRHEPASRANAAANDALSSADHPHIKQIRKLELRQHPRHSAACRVGNSSWTCELRGFTDMPNSGRCAQRRLSWSRGSLDTVGWVAGVSRMEWALGLVIAR